jgi:aspartate aminotransferase
MISERLTKMAQGGSAIRAMFEEGKRLAALYGKENVFDFSIGNPYFAPPETVKNAIVDIMTQDDPMSVHGYPANAGFPAVRKAVAESLNRRFDTAYDESNIIMTVGAAGGLNVTLNVLCNPGDEVIVISPYFFEYNNYIGNARATTVVVPAAAENGFMPDIAAIAAAVTPKTKALIINNPNNPTGVIYPEEMMKALGALLEQKAKEFGEPIYIISDEPYRELAYDGAKVPWLPHCYRNTIVGYSWSKSLSLPGERIGYLVIPKEADESELIIGAATVANRMLGFVNAPSLMQLAVARCLDSSTDIAAYDANRKKLYNGLHELGFACAYPAGAFYLWVKTPCAEADFVAAAKKYNLLLVPGTSFGCTGYVRLAYCVSGDMIERSMPAFAALAKEFGLK